MNPAYLDHAATTPVRKEVRAVMEPYALGAFGNASSTHRWGQVARAALENARAEIAESLGAQPSEIRFIRGGTESDNLALIGSYRAQRESSDGRAPSVVVTAVEHSAVLETAAYLETSEGASLTTLPVSPDGTVDLSALEPAIADGPATVSMMWVNNETGIILPVGEATQRAHGLGALMHTDACQALGKVCVHLGDVPVDLLTATAHKINGPKGMGLLFVREGTSLNPLIHGGSQEQALRPGTEDIAGAVGLATAVRLAVEEQAEKALRLEGIRDNLEEGLQVTIPGLRVNCAEAERACHVSSLGIPNVSDAAGLLMALDLEGIAVSGGSACHSGSGKGSHVIGALYGEDDPMATVRVSFGLGTSEADIELALEVLPRVVTRMTAGE
jgi:cysteine desulfurase